ncbi:MAG TPA: LLM class flavin-dependent oxidoreductase [Stellaceae bacterium]|jgi:alkanesulfonate monooxygenase SsuD/methylene tetrahydromethanopterin reductase-like flavin-dependent oxidoreductase (luciferase family)|nr:LLM class flavin-dependent oxidoreductase [Stellaceae bacterium]
MDFGMQFFPDVGPAQKSGQQYFSECLRLTELCDGGGWGHVRTVEHYFNAYGGYSPNPLLFLAAAAERSKKAKLITGAVLPIFNNPLKLAGEIGMLDAISNGRVEIGFARAFLPHEFSRFGVPVDESRDRFNEGMEQVRRLLEEENVTCAGRFHSFKDVTSLPRPTQKPRPPFWVAAIATPQSFTDTGKAGHSIMAIPMAGGAMKDLITLYRQGWKDGGHAGKGRVMLAFHLFCHENRETAWQIARDPLNRYLRSLVDAASEWAGMQSKDYPGYDKIIDILSRETIDTQVKSGAAWIGTPDDISKQIEDYFDRVGGFESASVQLNFNTVPYADAERSARLFAEKVMPRFATL